MGVMHTLQGTSVDNRNWNFTLLAARDADIAANTRYGGKNTPLSKAVYYLNSRLSLPEQPQLLQPLGP